MVKNELIKRIAEKMPLFFEKDVGRSVKTMINSISDVLVEGGRVEIRGFGSFYLKEYEDRQALNPQTGGSVQLGSRRMPHFRVGKNLHNAMNVNKNEK